MSVPLVEVMDALVAVHEHPGDRSPLTQHARQKLLAFVLTDPHMRCLVALGLAASWDLGYRVRRYIVGRERSAESVTFKISGMPPMQNAVCNTILKQFDTMAGPLGVCCMCERRIDGALMAVTFSFEPASEPTE